MSLATIRRMDNALTPQEIDLANAIWKSLSEFSAEACPTTLTLDELQLLDRFGIEDKDWELAGWIKRANPILSRVTSERSREQYFQNFSRKGDRREHWTLAQWHRVQAPYGYRLRELLSLALSTQDDRLPV